MKNIKCEEEAPKISVIDSDQVLFLNIDKKSEKKTTVKLTFNRFNIKCRYLCGRLCLLGLSSLRFSQFLK